MNDPARRTDRELFDAVASGEAQALAELVGRHARGLYDFALRGTLDEQQAAAVVESAFRRVRQPGAQIPSQIDFRTWLYSLCLIEILAAANESRTARISTEDDRFVQRTSDIPPEFARWAWQAARGLRSRDYCVLDLTLRRGLTPEEVAEAASLTRSNLYGSIGRSRGAFEETYAAVVLFERGRDACQVLNEMVDAAPGNSLRPALRHQIIEHAEDCDACRRTLDALPPAATVFVSLADIAIPDNIVRRILDAPASGPRNAGTGRDWQAPGVEGAAAGAAGIATAAYQAREASSPASPPPERGEQDFGSHDGEGARESAIAGTAAAVPLRARTSATDATTVNRTRERMSLSERQEGTGARLAALASRQPILWTYVLLGVAAVLAIYLGIAVADSLQSGGSDSGAVPLDSAANGTSAGNIECGGPLEMNHGTPTVVSFNEDALDGYEISTISYVPVSETASFEDLEGTLENPYLIRLTATAQDPNPPRTEEFELHIEWERGEDTATSVCRLLVHVGE